MKEINKKDITMPTEPGWYLCKYVSSSVTHYKDEDTYEKEYDMCNCSVKLLYWEGDLWVLNPRSYDVIEDRHILAWTMVPDDFNITDEKIKVNY